MLLLFTSLLKYAHRLDLFYREGLEDVGENLSVFVLVPSLSKIHEQCPLKQISQHYVAEKNAIISSCQHRKWE